MCYTIDNACRRCGNTRLKEVKTCSDSMNGYICTRLQAVTSAQEAMRLAMLKSLNGSVAMDMSVVMNVFIDCLD